MNYVICFQIFEDYYSIQHDDVPMGMRTPTVAMQDLLEADERVTFQGGSLVLEQ